MAYQSLILGILFSVGLFAVKSGIGIFYVIGKQKKKPAKLICWFVFAVTYFLMFAAAFFVLSKIDLVQYFPLVQEVIKSGMLIHLILAALMLVWGILLIKQPQSTSSESKGWLMLVVPCPVCMTVVFFTTGFLMTFFPEKPTTVTGLLYLGFLLINLITAGVLGIFQQYRQAAPESFLGGAMVLIAVYFFLSVTVMPQFADMDKVYRMAAYQGKSDVDIVHSLRVVVISGLAFAGGFGFRWKQIRSAI